LIVVVVPEYELSVGSKAAEMVIDPLVEGRNEQVAVPPAATAFLVHPGIGFPFTLKVTLPATETVALKFFAWRKVSTPGLRETVAL
jgi:hypothetical protein